MNETEQAIQRVRDALAAGPHQQWNPATQPNGRGNGWRTGPHAWLGYDAYSKETAADAALVAACNPAAMTLILAELDRMASLLDRHTLQADGTHPAPCARHCEAQAFRIEARQKDAALLKVARMAEALKLDCGMDPESPQAVRNAEYMNISYVARAAMNKENSNG